MRFGRSWKERRFGKSECHRREKRPTLISFDDPPLVARFGFGVVGDLSATALEECSPVRASAGVDGIQDDGRFHARRDGGGVH